MAIAKMRKINLIAMTDDKDVILDALQTTGAVEVKKHVEIENTFVNECDVDNLKTELSALESSIDILSVQVNKYIKENNLKSDALKDGFDVSYSCFMDFGNKREYVLKISETVKTLFDEQNKFLSELSKKEKERESEQIYSNIEVPFSGFSDTRHVLIRLGTISSSSVQLLQEKLKNELVDIEFLAENDGICLIAVIFHESVSSEVLSILSEGGFSLCPYTGEISGKQLGINIEKDIIELNNKLKENGDKFFALKDNIKELKIYYDYLSFNLEKSELSYKTRETDKTFLLEAYVPEKAEELIKQTLDGVSNAVYYEFSELSEDEYAPTLTENNPLIRNYEAVTNVYSVPNYREFDPNAIMALFYTIFLGFIVGDAGYGIVLFFGAGAVYFKLKRDGMMKRLCGIFSVGGLISIIWGILFNSLFGIAFLPFNILPDPQNDMVSLIGIRVPAVLVISLFIGIIQLFVGYICRAWQDIRRGHIADGICDGITWAIFTVGTGIAIIGFIDELAMPSFAKIGGIIAAFGLLTAVLTAGRKEKFFGKFTKGFGAAYGVINYAADVLSYARLYGLMLSGAVIAQIVSNYAISFITGGNPALAVLGVILLLVGHAFNLAMNLLSAYIHDARLQYVEFYGRFFEGDGELFTPLGSVQKYIYITRDTADL